MCAVPAGSTTTLGSVPGAEVDRRDCAARARQREGRGESQEQESESSHFEHTRIVLTGRFPA